MLILYGIFIQLKVIETHSPTRGRVNLSSETHILTPENDFNSLYYYRKDTFKAN
jgi:hypothetical protein